MVDVLERIANEEQERAEADRIMLTDITMARALVRETKRRGIDVNHVYADTKDKRELLVDILGYSALHGVRARPIPIEMAKPSRVGKAFKERYNAALKYCSGI